MCDHVTEILAIFAGQKGPLSIVNRAVKYEPQLTEVTFKSGKFLLVSVAIRINNRLNLKSEWRNLSPTCKINCMDSC